MHRYSSGFLSTCAGLQSNHTKSILRGILPIEPRYQIPTIMQSPSRRNRLQRFLLLFGVLTSNFGLVASWSAPTTRRTWISNSLPTAATVLLTPTLAAAADDSNAKTGTKEDPVFQACLSKCIYDCTKPKGDEQKSRAECRAECKASCAKTKEQRGIGNKR